MVVRVCDVRQLINCFRHATLLALMEPMPSREEQKQTALAAKPTKADERKLFGSAEEKKDQLNLRKVPNVGHQIEVKKFHKR